MVFLTGDASRVILFKAILLWYRKSPSILSTTVGRCLPSAKMLEIGSTTLNLGTGQQDLAVTSSHTTYMIQKEQHILKAQMLNLIQ